MEDRKKMQQTLPSGKTTWREIKEGKQKFQEIVRILVDFDERTGRHEYQPLKECHYMRKAIALGQQENLRILACSYPSSLYYVAAELKNNQGQVATCWVHEDGIQSERQERRDEPDHPVHNIPCMTDLFEKNAELAATEKNQLSEVLQQLMDRADVTDEVSANPEGNSQRESKGE